ncbi:MAG: hypothetical protein AAF467_27105 [Actinomycetota bacterium]
MFRRVERVGTELTPDEFSAHLARFVGPRLHTLAEAPRYHGEVAPDGFTIRRHARSTAIPATATGRLVHAGGPTTYEIRIGGGERFVCYAVIVIFVLIAAAGSLSGGGLVLGLVRVVVPALIAASVAVIYRAELRSVHNDLVDVFAGRPLPGPTVGD